MVVMIRIMMTFMMTVKMKKILTGGIDKTMRMIIMIWAIMIIMIIRMIMIIKLE